MELQRKMVIALLNLGFAYKDIRAMTETEAALYIELYNGIVNPKPRVVEEFVVIRE